MSAVTADPAVDAVPLRRGKKKLVVIAAGVLALVLALAGGGAYYLKQKAARAAAEAGDDDSPAGDHARTASGKVDPKNVPTYLPLDPFVVNLADKEADRYAQIGITFELESGGSVETMKAYMPSIRNTILLILANKTSRQLIDRAGKEQLAEEIMREAVRPMGIEVAEPEPVTAAASAPAEMAASAVVVAAASAAASAATGGDDLATRPKKTKPKRFAQKNPIQHVHFSSFIIQ
ncbi:MAG: flagellar basal body-associated FliL family protein [Caldimonas sp.]